MNNARGRRRRRAGAEVDGAPLPSQTQRRRRSSKETSRRPFLRTPPCIRAFLLIRPDPFQLCGPTSRRRHRRRLRVSAIKEIRSGCSGAGQENGRNAASLAARAHDVSRGGGSSSSDDGDGARPRPSPGCLCGWTHNRHTTSKPPIISGNI